MNRNRILIGTAAAIVTAVVAVLGGAFGGGSGGVGARAQPTGHDKAALGSLLSGLAGNNTAAYVRRLEGRVERRPDDASALVLLGLAYQQRARETGDPRFFSLSDRALRRGEASPATAGLAKTGLAALSVSRHRFAAALPLARAALHADPSNGTAYGALGDALLNLGQYRKAFAAYDKMAELSPSVGSYGRVANAREVTGRPRAAMEPLRLALTLDVPIREYRAAAFVQLGNIAFNMGRLGQAQRDYAKATAALPGYVQAQAGLAHVAAERGDYGTGAALFARVVDRLPLPQYVIWQGDTLRAAGREREARRAYALVRATERIQAANGVRTELQTAIFDLDHGHGIRDALGRAREAYRLAPSIDAADGLAWALERNGRCGDALAYSRRALRLGTRDALKFFHRGMIERCLGRRDEARSWFQRALSTNPYFSLLWVPVARRYAG
ncbi:MAG TPA: tetratricopeptide repeat protein [Thermoleophilaceae bacterium]